MLQHTMIFREDHSEEMFEKESVPLLWIFIKGTDPMPEWAQGAAKEVVTNATNPRNKKVGNQSFELMDNTQQSQTAD